MKMLKAAGALAVLALAFPGAASANTGSATVSCTAADYQFSLFQPGSNTIHYKVTVDNAVVTSGDFTLNEAGGNRGTLHVPLTVYGNHTVSAYAWWGPVGTVAGHTGGSQTVPMKTGQVTCAPAPPAAAPAPPAPAPPAAAPAPAAATAPAAAAPAPQGAVEAVKVSTPASARLGAKTSCADRAVRVTVAGRQMRSVAFSINGRVVRTVAVRAGQRSVNASLPMRNRRASQVVTARVRFRNGAAPRTMSARANRCAQAAVQPQFTG